LQRSVRYRFVSNADQFYTRNLHQLWIPKVTHVTLYFLNVMCTIELQALSYKKLTIIDYCAYSNIAIYILQLIRLCSLIKKFSERRVAWTRSHVSELRNYSSVRVVNHCVTPHNRTPRPTHTFASCRLYILSLPLIRHKTNVI